MLRAHLPQEVPAPFAAPISFTVCAPSSMAATIEPLVTASQRQTHTCSPYPSARS
jgi:hypothetical protein